MCIATKTTAMMINKKLRSTMANDNGTAKVAATQNP